MKKTMKLLGALLLGTMVATPAMAAPVTLGTWYTFAFGGPGSALYSSTMVSPGYNPDGEVAPAAPWTFTLARAGYVTVVDGYNSGDQFRFDDFGSALGTTSLVDTTSGCGGNISGCLANPGISKGRFALSAGNHSLSGIATRSPFGEGAAFFQVSDVPEPATWAMMVLGFGVVGAAMRRRPTVSARYSFACSRLRT